MRYLVFLSLVLVSAPMTIASENGASGNSLVDVPAVNSTVRRSVAWLEQDMETWRNEHHCSACHHGPMYLWSVNMAKQQGYAVNEQRLEDLTKWLLTSRESRIFPKDESPTAPTAANVEANKPADKMTADMMGHKSLSQPTIYLTHALNALPANDPMKSLGWNKVINHLAASQMEDGSFAGRNAWRPIFNTPQVLTWYVVAGIQDAAEHSQLSVEQKQVLKRGQAFLASQTLDETQQDLVLRILGGVPANDAESGTPSRESIRDLVHQLMALQRTDGGWAQTAERDSDAFATGQALVALHRAGIPQQESSVQRAIQFLVRTQRQDGTWTMTSRPNPEDGKPAEFLNPITYAATAYATIGLSKYVRAER